MARIDVKGSKKLKDIEEAKASKSLELLASMSPREAAEWIDENVKKQADIKALLKTLTKAVIALSHSLK